MGFTVRKPHPLFELIYLGPYYPPFNSYLVGFWQFISWMGQAVCQLGIICQNNRAGGIGIEPANTKNPFLTIDKVYRLFSPLRIGIRTDHAFWLI